MPEIFSKDYRQKQPHIRIISDHSPCNRKKYLDLMGLFLVHQKSLISCRRNFSILINGNHILDPEKLFFFFCTYSHMSCSQFDSDMLLLHLPLLTSSVLREN